MLNGTRYASSIIVRPNAPPLPWNAVQGCELTIEHVVELLACDPEILLLGTGRAQVFPPPDTLTLAFERGVGVEIMDTTAACRTFNLLAAEDRLVIAGLML